MNLPPKIKTPLLRATNYLLYLGACLLAGTGWLLAVRLPRGCKACRWEDIVFAGWERQDWRDFHGWVGLALVVLTIIHLALNAAWLRVVAAQKSNWKLWGSLALGLAILGFFAVAPL